MLGIGIAGIASNLLRALTLVLWPINKAPNNAFKGALVYYLLAATFMVICGMC